MAIPYTIMTRRADFLAANRGLRIARPGFVLLANANDGLGQRAGITVTRKIGNAVVRNRMKRRFRALLREILPQHGMPHTDHVLIGREGGVERDFAQLREELVAALDRARAGKGDPPRRRKGSGPARQAGATGRTKPAGYAKATARADEAESTGRSDLRGPSNSASHSDGAGQAARTEQGNRAGQVGQPVHPAPAGDKSGRDGRQPRKGGS